jgi:pyruvate/2-oxoglutarate dehydrogenase complex dihydrolipoamide dehydrogenase (E3) component
LVNNAGEVLSAVQLAMLGGLRYQQVRDAVLTHPTMGEGLNLLLDALDAVEASRPRERPR